MIHDSYLDVTTEEGYSACIPFVFKFEPTVSIPRGYIINNVYDMGYIWN